VSGRSRRVDLISLLALPTAVGVVVMAQVLEGGSARSLWQPTAALVVFGGTLGAVLVSLPIDAVVMTIRAIVATFAGHGNEVAPTISQLLEFATESRRRGVVALESRLERIPEAFLRNALTLAVDGTNPRVTRQILDVESQALRTASDAPAEVLETAAGYTPTLGILGAVLGLIQVMNSLSEPATLGSGIAVAFVATVYGVGAANLVLLPLAGRLRHRSRQEALYREIVVEGIVALQEGLNPRLIEQKLNGYTSAVRRTPAARGLRLWAHREAG
jgi:chemotaxis protein MotA